MSNDPSHLSFQQDRVTFQGDATTVTIQREAVKSITGKIKHPAREDHLSLDEVTKWRIHASKTSVGATASSASTTGSMGWTAWRGEDPNSSVSLTFGYSGYGSKGHPRWFDDIYAGLIKYSASNISPHIALRIIRDVLEGRTVELLGYKVVGVTSNPVWISMDGLVRQEGVFKKRKEIYPWEDYQGCEGYDRLKWRCGEKTIGIARTEYINFGAVPMALNALANQFRSRNS